MLRRDKIPTNGNATIPSASYRGKSLKPSSILSLCQTTLNRSPHPFPGLVRAFGLFD